MLETLELELSILVEKNLIYVFIVLSAIIGTLRKEAKGYFSVMVTELFGTFFHELAHFIVAIILNGKPVSFSIIPKRQLDNNGNTVGYILGSVACRNMQWYNVFFIAFAPLLLLPLSYLVYTDFFLYFDRNIYTLLLYILSIISLVFSSIPSGTDVRLVVNKNILGNLIVPVILSLLFVDMFYINIF